VCSAPPAVSTHGSCRRRTQMPADQARLDTMCWRARVRACARADGRYWPTLHSVADNAVSSSIMLRIFMRTGPCRGAMVRAAGAQRAQTCGLVPQAGRRRRGVQSRCGEELWVDEFALVHCVCAIKTSADCGGALVWIDTAPRD
jgi:hypothetical protein